MVLRVRGPLSKHSLQSQHPSFRLLVVQHRWMPFWGLVWKTRRMRVHNICTIIITMMVTMITQMIITMKTGTDTIIIMSMAMMNSLPM